MTERVLLIKFGEIALKGRNRHIFEERLIAAIENNIKDIEGYCVSRELGRYILRSSCADFNYDLIVPKVICVPGIVSLSPCARSKDKSIENIKALALSMMPKLRGSTFKVKATRAHKDYPLMSNEIAAIAGKHILDNAEGLSVNLTNPDIILSIELRNYVYIYCEEIKGQGGLPVGTSGKATALLSAGIDSPVACYLMALRGCAIDAVYIDTPPYTSERALLKVKDVCGVLSLYTAVDKLYAVNLTDAQNIIKEKTPRAKFTIMLKRAMLYAAELIALSNGSAALVTGDSIGQVASQTVKSIAAIDTVVKMPVLRPLAGMDKHEITRIAQRIGTYDISIRPFQDCCTLFVPKHPETKPSADAVDKIWRRIEGLQGMIEEAVLKARVFEY